jgi:hypothetical protein
MNMACILTLEGVIMGDKIEFAGLVSCVWKWEMYTKF